MLFCILAELNRPQQHIYYRSWNGLDGSAAFISSTHVSRPPLLASKRTCSAVAKHVVLKRMSGLQVNLLFLPLLLPLLLLLQWEVQSPFFSRVALVQH